MIQSHKQKEKRDARIFARVGVAFFACMTAISYWRQHPVAMFVFADLTLFFLIAGTFAPAFFLRFFRVWMKAAAFAGNINRVLLLGIVYFLIITPTALLMRLAGKDPMQRKITPGARTYWEPRESETLDPARYEDRF